ncbi:hypothetical protein L1049_023952 [Liquidambar formosana]|uniref:Knl1 C-terminal RWD domain-containing protein n=1 Tax=Liquidambar formosana TaxID=63359 RepID=A0AAP0RU39_LIQFO
MGSKEAEELCNTETDEGTVALQKKRSRRVSFAEITSVHVFDRDDEYTTPPDPKPTSDNDNAQLVHTDEVLGFFKDLADSDDLSLNEDEADDGDDQVLDGRTSFLRPIESPSPGGTAFGSATSNDEDNFFGPVSSSFIRPGRLSDSVASDDNHDITMDSTAFSMHFRSLARSDSGGDSKTPSGVRLSFEEKTPSQNTTPTSLGSFMALTDAKKPILPSSTPVDRVSGGGDSNDMSLIGENPQRYDFGRLSPTLDALLAEGSRDLRAVSVSDLINTSESPGYPNKGSKVSTIGENGSGTMDLKDCGYIEPGNLGTHDTLAEEVSLAHIKVGEANDGSTMPINQVNYDCSFNKNDDPIFVGPDDHQIQTPNQITRSMPFAKSKDSIKDAFESSRPKLEFSAINGGTVFNMDDRVLQLDLSPQHESGYLHSTEGWVKNNPTEGMLITSATYSSLLDKTFDYRKDKKATHTPEKFVSPPMKSLEQKLSASQEYEGSLSRDLKQQDQYTKFVSFGSGQDGDSIENATSGSHLTAMGHKMNSLFMDKRAQSRSPFIEINNFKDSTSIKRMYGRDINLHDLQNEAETHGNFQTPLRGMDTLNFKLGSSGRNLQTGTDPSRFKNELSRGIKASSFGSASPYFCRRITNKPPLQKSTVERTNQSPSREEPRDTSHDNNMHSIEENSSGRKRRTDEIVLRDGDHVDEISKIQRSPKVHKGWGNDMDILLEQSKESNEKTNKIGDNTMLKHWADIFSKFSGDTKQLHSPSIDKLNVQVIAVLEDLLVHLQKVKTYEMLCSDIQSQKIFDHFSNGRRKRASETRLLLNKMIYEQAKLQLMCVKRERLLKRVQLLSSGTRESQMLKLIDLQRLSVPCARDAQVNDSHPRSLPVYLEGKHEVGCDKMATMRQEIEASERKIKHLTNSFHTLCKMKGELSCADTIELVNDHLKKRACCRFIRHDLQSWEIDDLESRNGHHNVVINYHGFIFQRFTVNADPVSSIVISNKLNNINITKNFPNMDACIAFEFVLKAETSSKYVGQRSFAQETQITSSLICNMLDVVEEVQLAGVELRNLTETRFHSPSAEQLDLQLCFVDFKSGRKVTLTLDMTCLKCGVYPMEILPSQLQAPAAGTQKSAPQSLLAEIRAAVESLRVGYSRIVRLCRCVSQVVQASSR